jgi:hypothetical protein
VEYVGQEEATQTAATDPPADQQARQAAFFLAGFFAFVLAFGAFE